ncbi:MAG: ABC transporter permease, partial [Oscillospiraceae bacterium]
MNTAASVAAPQGPATYKKRSQGAEIWRRFLRNKQAVIGLIMLLILVFMAVFAPVVAPFDPTEQNTAIRLQPPDGTHWFGTDELGRDIFSRITYGTRISLSVGLIAVSISCVAGCFLGAVSGYYGGALDNVIMRCVD